MCLKEFGNFKQKVNKARDGRNPQTGETVSIPKTTTITFTASKSLRVRGDEDDEDGEEDDDE